jgi:surface polysaccharide O-acyltransferase-like enzyme
VLQAKKESTILLRGISILAVVGIHILASFPPGTFTTSRQLAFFLSVDQLLRFSVPMFVFLSGYALTKKYQQVNFSWKEFVSRRLTKLLPLYFFWAAVGWIIFQLMPLWRGPETHIPWWQLLLTSRVDYHLYFVGMIFQLYLIFPFLRFLCRKISCTNILAVSIIFQLAVLLYFGSLPQIYSPTNLLQIDQGQYLFAGSWIAYFVLGMWIAEQGKGKNVLQKISPLLPIATFISWVGISTLALWKVQHHADQLFVLKFTQWQIFLYASLTILSLYFSLPLLTKLPEVLQKVFSKLGRHSYLIYMSHALLLRVLFTTLYHTWPSFEFALLISAIWMIGFWLSLRLHLTE